MILLTGRICRQHQLEEQLLAIHLMMKMRGIDWLVKVALDQVEVVEEGLEVESLGAIALAWQD